MQADYQEKQDGWASRQSRKVDKFKVKVSDTIKSSTKSDIHKEDPSNCVPISNIPGQDDNEKILSSDNCNITDEPCYTCVGSVVESENKPALNKSKLIVLATSSVGYG